MGSNKIIALPCICFSEPERQIIRKYDFMTFPEFLDNFYVRNQTKRFSYFQSLLQRLDGQIRFAVAPDGEYELMAELKTKYPGITWLFPVHKLSEVKIAKRLGFTWLAMPHRRAWRDYEVSQFIETPNFKKWYLGFWAETLPHQLHFFDGFDTTLPETYSGKYGKVWLNWGLSMPSNIYLPIQAILEQNVANFREVCNRLEKLEPTYQLALKVIL